MTARTKPDPDRLAALEAEVAAIKRALMTIYPHAFEDPPLEHRGERTVHDGDHRWLSPFEPAPPPLTGEERGKSIHESDDRSIPVFKPRGE